MKAWSATAPEGLASLRMVETSVPKPGAGQIRLRVQAVGLNHGDLDLLSGEADTGPAGDFIPGMEVAGIVEEQGEDAYGVFPGDRVMAWMPYGALAEEVVVDSGCCWVAPKDLTMPQIAAYSMAYGTAHMALTRRARIGGDETLLVIGAGGAVGQAALTLGRIMGCRTVAVAGSPEKCAFCLQEGADFAIDWQNEELGQRLKDLKIQPNVVLDTIGGRLFEEILDHMALEGRIIPIGHMGPSSQVIAAQALKHRNIDVIGFDLSSYLPEGWQDVRTSFSALAHMVMDGKLIPYVGHVYPFEKADEALKLLAEGSRLGKVVLQLNQD